MNYLNYNDVKKEFFFYKKGTAGGFQTMLFDLFAKSDEFNKQRLSAGFPMHFAVLTDYMESKSEEDFFKDILLEQQMRFEEERQAKAMDDLYEYDEGGFCDGFTKS